MFPSARIRDIWLIPLILCAAARAPSISEAATRPSIADQKNEARQAIVFWNYLPLLPSLPIQQVVHFKVNKGLLSFGWPVAIQPVQAGRIQLTDLPGVAKLAYMSNRKGDIFPNFEYYDFSDPDDVCKHLQVLCSSSHLVIVRDEEFPDGRLLTVSVIQTIEPTDPTPVTLRVQSNSAERQFANRIFTATTLSQLRFDHPLEYERYLRPMFAVFHQDREAFNVDDRAAWQVVSDVWKPSPETIARVNSILARLNSDDFATREAADNDLRHQGEQAALYLQSIDRSHFTQEQKARVTHLLIEFCPLSDDAARNLGKDFNFLMDCLASDDAELRIATRQHLEKLLNRPIDFDVSLPFAARMEAIANLRQHLPPVPATRG